MTDTRRDFLVKGTAATMGALAAGGAHAATRLQAPGRPGEERPPIEPSPAARPPADFTEYSRYHPSYGGPPESDDYLGKLVPGIRAAGLAPVPVTIPDGERLPSRIVDGVREFELIPEPVQREFLPGYMMNVWGFNGSLPGPVIEAYQGERVRIIVRNRLPEPTTIHWHGFELPVHMDGVPGLTQEMIPPGKTKVYEFDLHQTGSFFYHTHVPMQEAMGMGGFFIVHPKVAFEPTVDRDFALVFQNFFIPPNQTIADSMKMDWNWHTINGRSGPYTTPLVCKHGERVRVRLLNFSPMQHHPIHLHGHTYWVTGTEGGRIPRTAWQPMNNTVVGVAKVHDFEFIAFNPGDWIFHCHMVHHMMNHMVRQVGPRIRNEVTVDRYLADVDRRPPVDPSLDDPAFDSPSYPQKMQGMQMSEAAMKKLWNRREVQGMRPMWTMGVHGLMTVLRVLPEDLYDRVMHSDEEIPKGAVFEEIVDRVRSGT